MFSKFYMWLVSAVAFATVLGGYPYFGLAMSRVIGTGPVVFIEHDGRTTTTIHGPDAPRPEWVPVMPDSWVNTASHRPKSPGGHGGGNLVLLSHDGLDAITAFYMHELKVAGFRIVDTTSDLAALPMSGFDRILSGWNDDTKTMIRVDVTTASGILLPSRSIQMMWLSPINKPQRFAEKPASQ